MLGKFSETDRSCRQKEDALFQLSREVDRCKNSIANYELTEQTLKREILDLAHAKAQAEKEVQALRLNNADLQADLRQLSERLEGAQRENRGLRSSVELAKKHEDRYMKELDKCWDHIDQLEDSHRILELQKLKLEREAKGFREESVRMQRAYEELAKRMGDSEDSREVLDREREFRETRDRHLGRKASREDLEIEKLRDRWV